jgi:hypothetical protein
MSDLVNILRQHHPAQVRLAQWSLGQRIGAGAYSSEEVMLDIFASNLAAPKKSSGSATATRKKRSSSPALK